MLNIQRTDSTNVDFKQLVSLLDKDLAIRDGDDHAFYDQFNKIVNIKHCVVAYLNHKPVGCGAIKHYDETSAEVKRMFTLIDYRGRGIAAAILAEVEKWAAELGHKKTILETGIKQPEAIALYQKQGYHIVPNYGQYKGVANSVCMEKVL